MVITVTLNPAMDKTVTIDDFNLGVVNRVQNIRYDIGGKGINVSRVLKNFGVDSICTGFLGGIWEETFKRELSHKGIRNEFIHIDGNTRTNTKIVDNVNGIYTDINEPGPYISEDDLNSFINYFKAICSSGDFVILSGGVSQNIPQDIYGTLIKIARQKGAKVVFDADGVLLKQGLAEMPDIVKPNEHELENLFGESINSINDTVNAAKKLRDAGVSNVMVSLGEKGSLYIADDGMFHAEGLKVQVKSTVGAGDSMVAALVYCMLNNYSSKDTLRFANACGAAAVSLEGTQACTLQQVQKLLPDVKINILDK
jgi:1-phosphofructokinase